MALFKCENLNKAKGTYKVHDVSFEIEPGEIVGLIGVNGAGKSVLIKSILGLYRLDLKLCGGELTLDGKHYMRDMKEYKDRLGFVLNNHIFDNFSTGNYLARVIGPQYSRFDKSRLKELLKKFGISPRKKIMKMSSGEKLKFQLAFALSIDPLLLVMDEPTGNLDVDFRDEFYKIIREFVSDGKHSVLISTHLVEELETFSDKILWLNKGAGRGTVRFFGTIDELRDDFRIFTGAREEIETLPKEALVYEKSGEYHSECLVHMPELPAELKSSEKLRMADLKEIMYGVVISEREGDVKEESLNA